nr:hypothetical protein BaRGS_021728 [Batillaria attramentaria]
MPAIAFLDTAAYRETQNVMPGDTCHSYLLDKDAIVLKGMGKKTSPSEVCDVTVAAANNARWMFHIQTAVIMDCRVKILVYDKRIVVSAIPTPPVLVVGCASRDPGVIRFNSSVVTVRLYHKNESDYSFNLLITARDINAAFDGIDLGIECSDGTSVLKKRVGGEAAAMAPVQ